MERPRADLLDELACGADSPDALELSAVLEVVAALVNRRCALDAVKLATVPWRVDRDWHG